jgi:hypothetical protein
MDQSSKELARVGADDPVLPVLKHDRPMMLPARSVLRKKARPVLPRCADLDASDPGRGIDRALAIADSFDGRDRELDQAWIPQVLNDAQSVGARISREPAVAQIETQ